MPQPPNNAILAINSGSSSLKFGLFTQQNNEETPLYSGGADGIGKSSGKLEIKDATEETLHSESYTLDTQGHALSEILKALSSLTHEQPIAIGHRIVHGGPHLRQHQRIDDSLIKTLEASVHFAPLHIPPAVTLIRETEKLLPNIPQYACFDTAFHATMPETSYRFALPEDLYPKGVQRYGFHGLSYESIVHQLGSNLPSRIVCAHLGSGASLAALRDGRSIDTSMGMTPTGGIPMATRSGDLDPGVLLFLMRTEHMDADQLETMLNHTSGLTALSGGEADMRALLTASGQGDNKAQLAIESFVTAVRKYIGAYAAELGGLDLLVFTGGIGEHSEPIRNHIFQGLAFLGLTEDKIKVLPSQEEAQIARHCRRLLQA